MMQIPILSLIVFWPLVGIIQLLFIRDKDTVREAEKLRTVALFTTFMPLFLSLVVWLKFNPDTSDFQFSEYHEWIKGYGIHYHIGVDGISLFFILLTTLLMPVCILASWKSITKRVREYMIAFLLLEIMMLGVFSALDMVLFYFFFEAVLIPMFLIIGVWGGEQRVYAAFKFFLYTLAGSVLFLLALLYVYFQFGTTDMLVLMERIPTLPLSVQKVLWLAFFASFAVKVPMWPVHTWLPDAHVQAPTAGSVILAGVLLKLGGYGFLRLSLPMLPDASEYFAPFVFALSGIAVVYTSLVALAQTDMKKLIAYSSIAHMGFVTIGTFVFNSQGIEGAIFQMISHGLVSAALFLCVGVLYDRVHTKEIAKFGGLTASMPKYAFFFMVFTMASIGLPGTSGFIGELLILIGAYQEHKLVAAVAATGVILGAAYMLWLYGRVMFGEAKSELKALADLNKLEIAAFLPLAILALVLGVYPSIMTRSMHASTEHLIKQVQHRQESTMFGNNKNITIANIKE